MDTLVGRIQTRLQSIQNRMVLAAQSANRSPAAVRLTVVTKGQPISIVEAAVQAGANLLGENYPEESVAKITALGSQYSIQWHMIGHLQSRKSAIVARQFDLLQSLDRLEIARKLNQQLGEIGKVLPVLIEVNSASEESKSGWPAANKSDWHRLLPDIEQIIQLPYLKICGLMTMPPLVEDPESNRPYFTQVIHLRDYLQSSIPSLTLNELSMGTSSDFEVAIQEGATIVRVGSAILGPRPPKL